jgi:cytochrome c553
VPQHIVRLILLMVAFGVVLYSAKRYFTVDSFYEYGHYRGNSVVDIASEKPKFKGIAYCASCHVARVAEWSTGIHNSADLGKVVRCEVCHGPAGGRDDPAPQNAFAHSTTGPDHPTNLKLTIPADTRQLCTRCHERLTGRPLQQRQIVVADHAGTQQCILCHNPHSPKIDVASTEPTQAGDAAAGKVKAAACSGCHGAEGASTNLPGPSLAGQKEAYFIAALKAYGTGARDQPMMSAAAQTSDVDAANLAAYFSGLKCESTLTAEKQATLPGRAVASKCIACHGADGISGNRAWPNLVGFSKDYLVKTINAYKDGTRKNGVMAGLARDLNETDAENIASYYAGASCK